MNNYLRERKQIIKYNNKLSTLIKCGVHTWIYFRTFIDKKNESFVHWLTDFIVFKLLWHDIWYIKSQVKLFAPKLIKQYLSQLDISLNNVKVPPVDIVKNLGGLIVSDLRFTQHLCLSLFKNFYILNLKNEWFVHWLTGLIVFKLLWHDVRVQLKSIRQSVFVTCSELLCAVRPRPAEVQSCFRKDKRIWVGYPQKNLGFFIVTTHALTYFKLTSPCTYKKYYKKSNAHLKYKAH